MIISDERKKILKTIVGSKPPYKDFRPLEYPDQVWNTRSDGTLDVAHENEHPTRTQQQFKDECDINNILRSYDETGTINHRNPRPGIFTEFNELPVQDFQEAMNIVAYANSAFNDLPANIRSRFSNDPSQLVEFCNNPQNLEEAITLGLAEKKSIMVDQNANQNLNKNANQPPKNTKKTANAPIAATPQESDE